MILYDKSIPKGKLPEPLERVWQALGGEKAKEITPKLPHVSMSEILFMTTVLSIPKEEREWGIVTWMSEMFRLSRPSLYKLVERVKKKIGGEEKEIAAEKRKGMWLEVTENRLARTVLTASLPGKMAIRPLQETLGEAFGEKRSVGWLNKLILEAGRKAGEVLKGIDTSVLKEVIIVRDETFYQGQPVLLVIEPVSTSILLALAMPDRQAETWGLALLELEEQGCSIGGIVEDMAKMYPKSQKEAGLEVKVQKDIWHIQRDGGKVLRKLEREAFKASKKVIELEKKLLKNWNDKLFDEQYVVAVAKEDHLYDQHDAFFEWLPHLYDALELIDWRSGEIREYDSNNWLLTDSLKAMADIKHTAVQKWVKTLLRHQSQLLTSLQWLASAIETHQPQLDKLLPLPDQQLLFKRTVARAWRLQQALINGHSHFSALAQEASKALQLLIDDNSELKSLADTFFSLFDASGRTSSLIENVNGLLKQFLHNHRSFANLSTLQLYLNVFTLWHNTRVFQRGKRQGSSPYQIANIFSEPVDWLSLIGYPAN